jgi:hypothetical protein
MKLWGCGKELENGPPERSGVRRLERRRPIFAAPGGCQAVVPAVS